MSISLHFPELLFEKDTLFTQTNVQDVAVNPGVTTLIVNPASVELNANALEMLNNLTDKVLKLDKQQVQTLQSNDNSRAADYLNLSGVTHLIFAGVNINKTGNLRLAAYKPTKVNGMWLLLAHDLNTIALDKNKEKMLLWKALQVMYQIS